MRLLNTETQELSSFFERGRPPYAILSHTWEDDEVLFADIVNQNQDWRQKGGAEKVLGSCQLARENGFEHIWIDSCCIDKSSSAELSEAINSMFNWYMNAEVCYVYLTDVAEDGSIAECRWFKRGWTLQELIAPASVDFYDKNWRFINEKISMSSELASITGIDESLLRCGHSLSPPLLKDHHMPEGPEGQVGNYPKICSCGRFSSFTTLRKLQDYCVAHKMSWASTRETTRGEDIAYCLMGLFEVNMPLLYGEGSNKAFFRLQREILETSYDHSILAFESFPRGGPVSALASHPNQFSYSGIIDFRPSIVDRKTAGIRNYYEMATKLTKVGVSVELLMVPDGVIRPPVFFYGVLDYQIGENPLGRLAIPLHPTMKLGGGAEYLRGNGGLFEISPDHMNSARYLGVATGRLDPKTFPDRIIQMQHAKRQNVTISQEFNVSAYGMYKTGLPVPIHCISKSPGCAPYSVESEFSNFAILRKPGYPRLLVHTGKGWGFNWWASRIWMLKEILSNLHFVSEDSEDAGPILAKINSEYVRWFSNLEADMLGLSTLGGRRYVAGSKKLIVQGSSTLEIEVSVQTVEFLDWAMPEVTVDTTEMDPNIPKMDPLKGKCHL